MPLLSGLLRSLSSGTSSVGRSSLPHVALRGVPFLSWLSPDQVEERRVTATFFNEDWSRKLAVPAM